MEGALAANASRKAGFASKSFTGLRFHLPDMETGAVRCLSLPVPSSPCAMRLRSCFHWLRRPLLARLHALPPVALLPAGRLRGRGQRRAGVGASGGRGQMVDAAARLEELVVYCHFSALLLPCWLAARAGTLRVLELRVDSAAVAADKSGHFDSSGVNVYRYRYRYKVLIYFMCCNDFPAR